MGIRSSAAASETDPPIAEQAEQVNQAKAGAAAGNDNTTAQSVSQVAAGDGAAAEAPGAAQAAHLGNDTEQEATGAATAESSVPASAAASRSGETSDVEATSDAGTENTTTQTVEQTSTGGGTQTAVLDSDTTQTAVATATTTSTAASTLEVTTSSTASATAQSTTTQTARQTLTDGGTQTAVLEENTVQTAVATATTTSTAALATVESTQTTLGTATGTAGARPTVVLHETFADSTVTLVTEQQADRSTTAGVPQPADNTPWVHATGARVSAALTESLSDGTTGTAESFAFLSGPLPVGSAVPAFTDAGLSLTSWVGQGGWSAAWAPAESVPASGAPGEFGIPMPAVPSWSSGLLGAGGSASGGGALAGMAGVAVLAAVLALALPARMRSLTTVILSMRSRLYFPVLVGPD